MTLISSNNEMSSQSIFHDKHFIHSLRQQMLKFAMLQIHDEHLAEDAVQEAMISAYQHN
ncbi:hypothetical protein P4S72_22745 [Vibrio sp. PP-XX7]